MSDDGRLEALIGDGRWLRAVAQSLPEYALVIVDAELRVAALEGEPLRRAGVDVGSFVGRTVPDALAGAPSGERFVKHLRDAVRGEVTVADFEGFGLAARVRFGPVIDGDHGAIGALALCAEVAGEGLRDLGRARAEGLVEDERRAMERRLAVTDRLASLGVLTATLLHEIYNPLTAVLLAGDLARERLRRHLDAPTTEGIEGVFTQLDQMREGIEQVLSLGRELRSFTRAEPGPPRLVDLRDVVRSALRLCGNQLRYRATVVESVEHAPLVLGDERQLVQVAMNLIVNASQAMKPGEAQRNTVTVSVGSDEQGRAILSVEDDGPGVPASLRERIFEPFFTTRAEGEGSGLGLSIVRGIVVGLGGSVELDPSVTRGARFVVRLPPAPKGEAQRRARMTPQFLVEPRPRGRLLVIDDEPVLAEAFAALLSAEHEVDVETDPRAALERLRGGASYDLILCDLVMPTMSGMELYESLIVDRPELKERVVFLTGGGALPTVRRFLSEVPNPRVEKPVLPEVLRRLVRTWVRGANDVTPPPAAAG
ncbi:MAG: ATP-binding protein [Polyangiales bacterium]